MAGPDYREATGQQDYVLGNGNYPGNEVMAIRANDGGANANCVVFNGRNNTPAGGQVVVTPQGALISPENSAGAVLSIATNVITPTNGVHHLGAGLVKTITVPAWMLPGMTLTLIPDAAFTTDTTGNISLASTAVTNKALTFTWDGTKFNPSY